MNNSLSRAVLVGCAALSMVFAVPASSSAQDFYQNKTVRVLVGGTAGGGFDTISRVMANHLGRHIPGNPNFVVSNMLGGGGIVVANHIFNVAPRDGTTIGYIGPVVVQPLLSPEDDRIRFNAEEFTWVGSLGMTHSTLVAWHESPLKTIEDLFDTEMIVSGTGAASTTDIYPKVLNTVLGTRFRLITAYQGSKETLLAIERGEAHGRFMSYDSLRTTRPNWIVENKVRVLLQASTTRRPDLAEVTTALELAKTDAERQAIEFLFLPSEMGRPIAAPPEIPADGKEILQGAFAEMIKDPGFLKEADERGLEVDGPMAGEDVEEMVRKIYATPTDIVQMVGQAMQ